MSHELHAYMNESRTLHVNDSCNVDKDSSKDRQLLQQVLHLYLYESVTNMHIWMSHEPYMRMTPATWTRTSWKSDSCWIRCSSLYMYTWVTNSMHIWMSHELSIEMTPWKSDSRCIWCSSLYICEWLTNSMHMWISDGLYVRMTARKPPDPINHVCSLTGK